MNITIREKDKGFQAIVSYKKNGIWKQKSKQGFSTKKEAKAWANEMQFKLTEDRKDNIDSSDMTVKQALDIYLDYKKNAVKFSTYETIKKCLSVLNDIYDIEVGNLKPIQLTNIISEKQEQGYYYTNEQNSIRTFFNFCIHELKLIRDNPMILKKKKRKDERIKYIDEDLYKEILNNAKDEDKLFIKVAYHTGMRKSELLGLKYTDIDNCIINVERQKYNGKITGLKSENGYRQIPIPLPLYNEIKNIKVKNIDGFIFKKSVSYFFLNKYNLSNHCFRHTFATNLVAKGINLKVASEIVGDKFETFINTYVQSSEIERKKAFDIIKRDMTL